MFGKKEKLLKITVNAFYAIAGFWVVFGIYWLMTDSVYEYVYFVLGLIFAMILVWLGYYLSKRKEWAFWGSLFILFINIILTITDRMGWFDFFYLIPSIGLFMLVLMQKKVFKK
ncbi:MAG: hypothetical protein Q8P20_07605 [bacterium]|nr:hypothetical protein [bacterium]